MSAQITEADRAAFETWVLRHSRPSRRGTHIQRSAVGGVYTDNRVAAKWAAWQAALLYARTTNV